MPANEAQLVQLKVDQGPARTVVYCSGKININSWPQFSVQVSELIAEGKTIRVDLHDVTQIDSVGIGTLVKLWASATKNSCDLKYTNPSKLVADVIRITHLFPMFESPEPAERS